MPTTSSTLYAGPFSVGATTGTPGPTVSLRYFSVDDATTPNSETPKQDDYAIDTSLNPLDWGEPWGQGVWQ